MSRHRNRKRKPSSVRPAVRFGITTTDKNGNRVTLYAPSLYESMTDPEGSVERWRKIHEIAPHAFEYHDTMLRNVYWNSMIEQAALKDFRKHGDHHEQETTTETEQAPVDPVPAR